MGLRMLIYLWFGEIILTLLNTQEMCGSVVRTLKRVREFGGAEGWGRV